MDYNEFYRLIGQVTYSFARIDFLISNIAVDLGLVKTYQEFYAKRNFERKVRAIKDCLSDSMVDPDIRNEFDIQFDLLEQLRITRNNLTHAIILNNKDDFMLYNFALINGKVQREIMSHSMVDFKKINQDFIDLHNAIYTLWQKIKPV